MSDHIREVANVGDIIVYRERAQCISDDKIRRATYTGEHIKQKNEILTSASGAARMTCVQPEMLVVEQAGQRFGVWIRDVIRVEPSQHGWTGSPETSQAW